MINVYIYLSEKTYNNERPDIELTVDKVKRDGKIFEVVDTNGYTHVINLDMVFAITYR